MTLIHNVSETHWEFSAYVGDAVVESAFAVNLRHIFDSYFLLCGVTQYRNCKKITGGGGWTSICVQFGCEM